MDFSTIRYLPPKIEGNQILWTGEMKPPGGAVASIYFNFTCPEPEAFVPRLRPFLLAFLVPAMRVGHPLQFEQPVDQTTLHNLMEWQHAMACWFPGRLRVVPIRCPVEPEPPKLVTSRRHALTAFSGGVDSCFTAYRHTVAPETALYRRTQLGAGLMVHGFDIPETEVEVFDSAFSRSEQILDSLGLRAFRLRTNLRTLTTTLGCDWEYETHGIWLAAALACLEPWFERVLIPSSYPYPVLRLPWASSPVTDAFFASAATPVWHDGAACYKLTKVQAMAQHPGIQRCLRVCWEGAQMDRNCGHCFKCVATQVCFWLSGVPRPGCFSDPGGLEDVARARLKTASNRALFRVMQTEARRQGANDLVRALGRALQSHSRQKLRRKFRQLCQRPQEFFDQL
jgi:hypothetical protein